MLKDLHKKIEADIKVSEANFNTRLKEPETTLTIHLGVIMSGGIAIMGAIMKFKF